jgi:hypothetical protein
MLVKLTYFKRSGKYYSDAEYHTVHEELWDIWDEVKRFRDHGESPGLTKGTFHDFIVSVDIPDHPHNHPHLIV